MRVRQNLALVLALEGKFDEAQQVAGRDLTPNEASQNIAYIRGMVAQSNNWKKLKTIDRQAEVRRAPRRRDVAAPSRAGTAGGTGGA